jgi:hypothetical protein
MEERLQNAASVQQSQVVNADGTKRRFLQRTVQPIRSIKTSSSIAAEEGKQQATTRNKPPLHPQYSEEQRALHAIQYQKKVAVEQQVQQQLQHMQQLGLQPDAVRSSARTLAAASTPALHAALRAQASPANPREHTAYHHQQPPVARPLSNTSHPSHLSRGASPSLSQVRPQSCSTQSSVSRLSAGNLWKASDSAASYRSSGASSAVDSQIGYLEETLAREKLRRMAAESELAYLKEIVLTTRQQLSRPLL